MSRSKRPGCPTGRGCWSCGDEGEVRRKREHEASRVDQQLVFQEVDLTRQGVVYDPDLADAKAKALQKMLDAQAELELCSDDDVDWDLPDRDQDEDEFRNESYDYQDIWSYGGDEDWDIRDNDYDYGYECDLEYEARDHCSWEDNCDDRERQCEALKHPANNNEVDPRPRAAVALLRPRADRRRQTRRALRSTKIRNPVIRAIGS